MLYLNLVWYHVVWWSLYHGLCWNLWYYRITFEMSWNCWTPGFAVCCLNFCCSMFLDRFRADFRFAPSQWEMVLLCNDFSHWLGASLESALRLAWFNGSINNSLHRKFFLPQCILAWDFINYYTICQLKRNLHESSSSESCGIVYQYICKSNIQQKNAWLALWVSYEESIEISLKILDWSFFS